MPWGVPLGGHAHDASSPFGVPVQDRTGRGRAPVVADVQPDTLRLCNRLFVVARVGPSLHLGANVGLSLWAWTRRLADRVRVVVGGARAWNEVCGNAIRGASGLCAHRNAGVRPDIADRCTLG